MPTCLVKPNWGRGDGRPFVDGEEPLNSVRPNGRNKLQEVTIMLLRRLLVEDEGQTLVEYGLLVALIALAVIAALTALGRRIAITYNRINANLP
jgi:pilus assembly protein Flp/PilA